MKKRKKLTRGKEHIALPKALLELHHKPNTKEFMDWLITESNNERINLEVLDKNRIKISDPTSERILYSKEMGENLNNTYEQANLLGERLYQRKKRAEVYNPAASVSEPLTAAQSVESYFSKKEQLSDMMQLLGIESQPTVITQMILKKKAKKLKKILQKYPRLKHKLVKSSEVYADMKKLSEFEIRIAVEQQLMKLELEKLTPKNMSKIINLFEELTLKKRKIL